MFDVLTLSKHTSVCQHPCARIGATAAHCAPAQPQPHTARSFIDGILNSSIQRDFRLGYCDAYSQMEAIFLCV